MRILVLYTRLSGYFIAGLQEFLNANPHAEINCIAYNPSKDAPFLFPKISRLRIWLRDELDYREVLQLMRSFQPTSIYTVGWSDSLYNKICKDYNGQIPVIVSIDNPWIGSIRQRIGILYFRLVFGKYFDKAWVAGIYQYEFARRLGFSSKNIRLGQYTGDNKNFYSKKEKREDLILFIGRLVEFKRPDFLVRAFVELCLEYPELGFWRLRLIGKGPMKDVLEKLAYGWENIEILDFLHPNQLPFQFNRASIFCLPSKQEHWGVVVHEAAMCGLPLILSDDCGAGTEFLIDGYNGKIFKSDVFADFKKSLFLMMSSTQKDLIEMGERSITLAQRISLSTWCATFKDLISSP